MNATITALLIPGMEMGGVWPVTIGLQGGFAFLLLIDHITPHLHPVGGPEGPKSKLSKTTKLALAVTIHNFPEGMAVGVAIAGALSGGAHMTAAGALALSLGIAIQNEPEGAIISMPLRAAGNSRGKAFAVGALSGIVEPLGAALFFTACNSEKETTVYDFTAVENDGSQVYFADYKGKVLLIVNTASKCGFTPQYDGLEALYKQFKDKGLVVIGFPCDQFGHQEPGTNEEIVEFCRLNYGVTFPLMEKVEVNGENAHPIYKWLYTEKPFEGFGDGDTAKFMDGMLSRNDPEYASNPDIKWNFTKFLIDRKGRVVARFEPMVAPNELIVSIEKEL